MKITPLRFYTSKIAFQKKKVVHNKRRNIERDSFIANKESLDAKLDRIVNKRLNELQMRNVPAYALVELTILDEHNYQKMLFLLDKGMSAECIQQYIKINDKTYIKILQLLKLGVPSYALGGILEFDDICFKKALKLLKSGADISEVNHFCKIYDKEKEVQILKLIDNDVNYYLAKNCTTMRKNSEAFLAFKQMGFNDFASSIFANSSEIQEMGEEEQKSVANIIELIRAKSKKTYSFSEDFLKFVAEMAEFADKIKDFEEYIKRVDFEKLYALAPNLKKYSDTQLLDFLETHYNRDCTEFNKDDLTFENLSEFFGENYVDSKTLDKILNSYPLTSRIIGQVPLDWLENVNDKAQTQAEIEKEISYFQHHKDTLLFSQSLSKILNKKVNVEKLGAGSYGIAYKMEIESAVTSVIKTFHPRDCTYNETWHGRNIEPQAGLFANQNSNEFVKMYFARVCSRMQRDGFIVSQYLDENIIPQETIVKRKPNIKVGHADSLHGNIINNKIIDYGGIFITTLR